VVRKKGDKISKLLRGLLEAGSVVNQFSERMNIDAINREEVQIRDACTNKICESYAIKDKVEWAGNNWT
jgi:hypothetical protein